MWVCLREMLDVCRQQQSELGKLIQEAQPGSGYRAPAAIWTCAVRPF